MNLDNQLSMSRCVPKRVPKRVPTRVPTLGPLSKSGPWQSTTLDNQPPLLDTVTHSLKPEHQHASRIQIVLTVVLNSNRVLWHSGRLSRNLVVKERLSRNCLLEDLVLLNIERWSSILKVLVVKELKVLGQTKKKKTIAPRYYDPSYDDPRYYDPRYYDPRYDDPRYYDPRYYDVTRNTIAYMAYYETVLPWWKYDCFKG